MTEAAQLTPPTALSSSLQVMVYRLDLQANAQTLAGLDGAELRRRAVRAARDQDTNSLWELLEAHLILNGLSGAKASPHTLRAYRKGLTMFLEFAAASGVQLLRPRPNHGVAYARWLEGQGYSTSTVRVRLAAASRPSAGPARPTSRRLRTSGPPLTLSPAPKSAGPTRTVNLNYS